MLAIHLICARDADGKLRNLSRDRDSGLFRSGIWMIPIDDARLLVGGWLYLHATKAEPSEFGGRIVGFEPVVDERFARSRRVAFLVERRLEGTGQRWRGRSHGMAHSGGGVPAGLPHEVEPADS